MKSSRQSQIFVRVLLILVPLLGSGVRGQLCPEGQVTHKYEEKGPTRCCLPVDCEPNYYVHFCPVNGTQDSCEKCPARYRLLKRTSSFAIEVCHPFYLSDFPECKQLPGPLKASMKDIKNCFCNLEEGYFYLKAENTVEATSNCQPSNVCRAGEQPTQTGICEPCPRNTVQDIDGGFRLCRPQRNCTALRLETEILGDATKETVCAKPPAPPSIPPTDRGDRTTTPAPTTRQTSTARSSTSDTNDGSVGPVMEGTAQENFPVMWVIIVIVSVLALVAIVFVIICARRRGWFAGSSRCRRDMENPTCNGTQYPMSNRSDNDNTSDNSCCACADSCLASPSSSKGGSGGGASGKSGAAAWAQTKNPKGLPFPMLEAYMNMNGKCGNEPPGDGFLSEPLYNSISQDSSGKLDSGDNMATYKNVNGVPATMLRQEDFYNYPSKVRLSSSDDDDDGGRNAMNKDREIHRQLQQRRAAGRAGEDDFTETDPLLPNSENASSGIPTPVMSPGPRGILRNGPNRQEPRGGRGGGTGGGGGRGEAVPVAGNRPHLSMLLGSAEEPAPCNQGDGCQGNNVPHLSQLVSGSSAGRSAPSTGPQPHIPPPPQQPEVPEQHVHELPQQLQQHLLQQQRLIQQQLQQQEGPGCPRLVPVSQPQLNPSLVQMEELKPIMPLNPSPVNPDNPPLLPGVPPAGAANVMESKGRSESPARISPSQQEEVRGKGTGVTWKPAPTSATDTTSSGSPAMARKEARVENEINEQTFRKQAGPACSPGEVEDDEETAHKSVGGSSGLGESLDLSSLSDEGRKSRTPYRRSVSDVTRSISPSQPLPPLRSISIPSPEEKHRPFAVVKPMQSDQSLNGSQDRVTELTQPLDSAGRHYPLNSLRSHPPRRQTSQDSDPDLTRPKTPDRLSEDENEENDAEDNGEQGASEERTRANFFGNNDLERGGEDNDDGATGKDKTSDGRSSEG